MILRYQAADWQTVSNHRGPVFVVDNHCFYNDIGEALHDARGLGLASPIIQPCDVVPRPTPDFAALLAQHRHSGMAPAAAGRLLADALIEAWTYTDDDGELCRPTGTVVAFVSETGEAVCNEADADESLAGLRSLLAKLAPVAWVPRDGVRLLLNQDGE